VGSSIVSALGRYKRMECAKAGQVSENRPQRQAGLGIDFFGHEKWRQSLARAGLVRAWIWRVQTNTTTPGVCYYETRWARASEADRTCAL
ncbi:hypothetical protein, partial [Cupriavidus basilensis]|uniref:hypothetical protein n=1 Tax=Cupriavidus basilensis TaxID=68895 RepID=UPI0023E7F340